MKVIHLTQNKETLIDDEDYEKASKYKWNFSKKGPSSLGYAQRSVHYKVSKNKYRNKAVYLHRFLMNCPDGYVVDHINGNTLDNRKANLRIVKQRINMRNRNSTKHSTSKYVGVHLHKLTGKWRAQIRMNNKIKCLGLFKSQELAKDARDRFIQEYSLEGFRR